MSAEYSYAVIEDLLWSCLVEQGGRPSYLWKGVIWWCAVYYSDAIWLWNHWASQVDCSYVLGFASKWPSSGLLCVTTV